MEARNTNRIKVQLRAEIISGGNSHDGLVENLSLRGICVTTSPTASAINFIPGTSQMLKFKLNSDDTIDLRCDARWLHSFLLPNSDVVNTLGLQIVSPQLKYLEYVNTLKINY